VGAWEHGGVGERLKRGNGETVINQYRSVGVSGCRGEREEGIVQCPSTFAKATADKMSNVQRKSKAYAFPSVSTACPEQAERVEGRHRVAASYDHLSFHLLTIPHSSLSVLISRFHHLNGKGKRDDRHQ